MPVMKGLLAPQNTFLDTIATRFDGTRKAGTGAGPGGSGEGPRWARRGPGRGRRCPREAVGRAGAGPGTAAPAARRDTTVHTLSRGPSVTGLGAPRPPVSPVFWAAPRSVPVPAVSVPVPPVGAGTRGRCGRGRSQHQGQSPGAAGGAGRDPGSRPPCLPPCLPPCVPLCLPPCWEGPAQNQHWEPAATSHGTAEAPGAPAGHTSAAMLGWPGVVRSTLADTGVICPEELLFGVLTLRLQCVVRHPAPRSPPSSD